MVVHGIFFLGPLDEMYRPMQELHERKKLEEVLAKPGVPVRGVRATVCEFVDYWDQVPVPTKATEEECLRYPKILGRS